MEKHSNNLHHLIHVILDFSLSFVQILFSPFLFSVSPTLPLSFCLTLSIPSSLILSGRHSISHLGEQNEGKVRAVSTEASIFFFFFFIFFCWYREKERPKCPFSCLLHTFTYFSLLSHTLADTDSFPRVFSLQLSCLSNQQELLVKMTFTYNISVSQWWIPCNKNGMQVNSLSIFWAFIHKLRNY